VASGAWHRLAPRALAPAGAVITKQLIDELLVRRVESQFELDQRRDDDAVAHGGRPLRFTWRLRHDDVAWVWEKVAGARRHAEVGRRASA
jgi:hypothetical protein